MFLLFCATFSQASLLAPFIRFVSFRFSFVINARATKKAIRLFVLIPVLIAAFANLKGRYVAKAIEIFVASCFLDSFGFAEGLIFRSLNFLVFHLVFNFGVEFDCFRPLNDGFR